MWGLRRDSRLEPRRPSVRPTAASAGSLLADTSSFPSTSRVDLDALISDYKPGYSLEQAFYTDSSIFEEEYRHIFSRQWQFVDHISRIPNRGDYFLFSICGEEIVEASSWKLPMTILFSPPKATTKPLISVHSSLLVII